MHHHKGCTRMQISGTEAKCVSSALISFMCNWTKETNWWWRGPFFSFLLCCTDFFLSFLSCSTFSPELNKFIQLLVIWKRSTKRKILFSCELSWIFSFFNEMVFRFYGRKSYKIVIQFLFCRFKLFVLLVEYKSFGGVVKSAKLFHLTFP